MQLDKTLIVVRERSVFDTLDLALRVWRIYAWPLCVTMFLGAGLWAVVNYFLTGWMLQPELDAPDSPDQIAGYVRYTWTMVILVFVESPLASAFATVYLGQALFVDRPRIRDTLREVLVLVPRLIWCHVLLRGVLVALVLVYAIDRFTMFSGTEVFLVFLFLGLILRRATAPFINEIVLLERNPLRTASLAAMTVHKRSMMLHGPATGNLINLALDDLSACVSVDRCVLRHDAAFAGRVPGKSADRARLAADRLTVGTVADGHLHDRCSFSELPGSAHSLRRVGGRIANAC